MYKPPTKKEIRAVQAVLYAQGPQGELDRDLKSIQALMNISGLDNPLCQPSCYPLNDPVAAAPYCDRIASTLLSIRADLAAVHVNARDKELLRTALADLAASWRARAKAWRANGRGDQKAYLKAITTPYRASAEAFFQVEWYLR